tara:strand:+ start:1307 stop:1552 length:246 start_codon:yes stop_codon:yes gene_type:complete
MWKEIIKGQPLGDRSKYIAHANKLDKYVKQNIYGLMGELEKKIYNKKISELKGNSTNPENKLRSLLSSLYGYNIPRELREL